MPRSSQPTRTRQRPDISAQRKERYKGIVGFLIVGLICGALAKAILADRAVGGWLASLVIGVIGALVGGWIGSAIFDIGLGGFFDIRTWLLALGGSLLVLVIYAALTGRKR